MYTWHAWRGRGAGAWKEAGGRSGQRNEGVVGGAHSRGGADLGHRYGGGARGGRAARALEHILAVEAVRRDAARADALEQLRGEGSECVRSKEKGPPGK